MFMGRMVKEPADILIYGRAIGTSHKPDRDDATAEEIQARTWKRKWPHYIRVHHAEFLAGNLGLGVSLNELMGALGANAFATTQQNARSGLGNTDPRKAYMRQAAVRLSPEGSTWLNERLELAYANHGKLAPTALQQLDWPTLP
jgi:hypothetical protein